MALLDSKGDDKFTWFNRQTNSDTQCTAERGVLVRLAFSFLAFVSLPLLADAELDSEYLRSLLSLVPLDLRLVLR